MLFTCLRLTCGTNEKHMLAKEAYISLQFWKDIQTNKYFKSGPKIGFKTYHTIPNSFYSVYKSKSALV